MAWVFPRCAAASCPCRTKCPYYMWTWPIIAILIPFTPPKLLFCFLPPALCSQTRRQSRTMVNLSSPQSATCHRLATPRFKDYSWYKRFSSVSFWLRGQFKYRIQLCFYKITFWIGKGLLMDTRSDFLIWTYYPKLRAMLSLCFRLFVAFYNMPIFLVTAVLVWKQTEVIWLVLHLFSLHAPRYPV